MNILKKLITVSLLSLLVLKGYSQTVTPTQMINSTILDTVKTEFNSTHMRILWWNDTIKVKVQREKVEMNPALVNLLRKDANDPSLFTKQDEIDKFLKSIKIGAQNCYSYALERYFDKDDTFNQNTFNKSSDIDRESAEKILSNYFTEVAEISTASKRDLDQEIPNESVLAFENESGWAIHFVYYRDEVFYSKNGAFAPIEFKSLKKFLRKHYSDTEKIVVYQIDKEKVR